MFNPEKVVTIIKHVTEKLEKQDSYRLGVDLLGSELTELRKRFNVELDEAFGNFDNTYLFTKKQ
jgi:tmRNA-binding protein